MIKIILQALETIATGNTDPEDMVKLARDALEKLMDAAPKKDSGRRLIGPAAGVLYGVSGEFTRESKSLYRGKVIATNVLDLTIGELDCYVVMDNKRTLRLVTRDDSDDDGLVFIGVNLDKANDPPE
jgi:hypothetical protein